MRLILVVLLGLSIGGLTLLPSPAPAAENGVTAVAITTGSSHTCALVEVEAPAEGYGVKCWGWNGWGQLGTGAIEGQGRWAPVDVVGLESGVSAVGAGGAFTCALTTAGGVKCWGRNVEGQLGDGQGGREEDDAVLPVDVIGLESGVAAIAVGGLHACALLDDGGVKCWGDNRVGALGAPTDEKCRFLNEPISIIPGVPLQPALESDPVRLPCSTTPVDVLGLDGPVTALSAGGPLTCALGPSGMVQCWGANQERELGAPSADQCLVLPDFTLPCSLSPVTVCQQLGDAGETCLEAYSGAIEVQVGGAHGCALTSASGVACWGGNRHGQLGAETDETCDPSGTFMFPPVPCSTTPLSVDGLGEGVAALAADGSNSCVVTDAGDALCWGESTFYQLGDGTGGGFGDHSTAPTFVCASGATPPCSPEQGNNLTGVTAIATGRHTCALMADGGVKCWGSNAWGRLGDGTNIHRPIAVDVVGLGPKAEPTPTPTPPPPAGDADCSGEVTSVDAALVLQFDAALLDALPCEEEADADGDGAVTSVDAALILQFTSGLLDGL